MFKSIFRVYLSSFSGLSKPAWMLALVMLLNRIGAMVIPFLAIYVTKVLGFSKVDAGIVLSTFGIGSVIGSVLGGWLTDKWGSFKVQSLSLFLSAPIFALIPYFSDFYSVCAIILLLSVVTETFRPSNSASITLYAKPENLTRAFSLNRMAINLGFSFGPALGGLLATISYSWLFFGNAIGAFVTGIVFYAYFRFRKKNKTQVVVEEIVSEELVTNERSPYKDVWFLKFSFFCMLYSIVFIQLISVLPLYYEEIVRMSQQEIGLILGFSGFFIVIFEMLIVHVAEKKLRIFQTIIGGTSLLGLSFVLLLFSHATWVLYGSMILLCISEILVLPFISTVAANRASARFKGAYMGVNGLSFSIALIFTPYAATQVISHFGYEILWILDGIIALIAMLGFQLLVKSEKK